MEGERDQPVEGEGAEAADGKAAEGEERGADQPVEDGGAPRASATSLWRTRAPRARVPRTSVEGEGAVRSHRRGRGQGHLQALPRMAPRTVCECPLSPVASLQATSDQQGYRAPRVREVPSETAPEEWISWYLNLFLLFQN